MDDGVWRTVSGRRIFIKDGQSLEDAMKQSGKFNNDRDIKIKEFEEQLQAGTGKTELFVKDQNELKGIVKDYKNGGYKLSENEYSRSSLTKDEIIEAKKQFENTEFVEKNQGFQDYQVRYIENEIEALKAGFDDASSYNRYKSEQVEIKNNKIAKDLQNTYLYSKNKDFFNNYGEFGIEYNKKSIMKTLEKDITSLGYERYYTSDSGSIYLSKGNENIRISDHYLPDTAERIYNQSRSGSNFDTEIIVNNDGDLNDLIKIKTKKEMEKYLKSKIKGN